MSISPLRQKITNLTHKRVTIGIFALLLNLLLLSVGSIFTPVYAAKAAPRPSWSTFHDPVYGFSIQYPATWTLMPESDGSHITLFNPATRSSMSPIVTTQEGAPAAVLKQALAVAGAKTLTIAGHQAIDSLAPYVPAPQTKNQDTALPGGPQQVRQVTMPVTNTTNSTNVYLFRLTQLTDAKGKISTAVQADQTTFEAMLTSFTLPVKVASVAHPAKSASALSPQAATVSGCNRICWADANWSYNYYDDSAGLYSFACDARAYNSSYTTSSSACVDGNIYGAQVAGSGQYFQPNFQCADFVSRTLTQDGLVPGLNNGGVNGSFPATSPFGGYSSYRAANGSSYDLLDVGVPGVSGLSNYLLDNGLATNIHQNVAQAAPGDVVFFFNGTSGTYEHTMFITSISSGNLVLDGHNMAQYHAVVSASGLDIYHLTSATSGGGSTGGGGGTGTPAKIKTSPTVLSNSNGTQDLFMLGSDGHMWWIGQDASGNWNSWNWFTNMCCFTSAPTVIYNADKSKTLFALGSDSHMWWIGQDASGNWNSWNWFTNNGGFASAPTVIYNADKSKTLFALGSDGHMWWIGQDTSGNWNSWNWFTNNGGFASAPAVLINPNNTQTLFALDSNGQMWWIGQDTSGNWNSWNWFTNVGGFASAPVALTNPNKSKTLFALSTDGHMWWIGEDTSGNWNSWNWFENQTF